MASLEKNISKNYFTHTLYKFEKYISTFKNIILIGVTWAVENKDLGTTKAFLSPRPFGGNEGEGCKGKQTKRWAMDCFELL